MSSYFGIYRGVCVDNEDPENNNRIKLKVPQVLNTNITNWAYPCLPVTDNANHPDHEAHTAAQIAALLTTTPETITVGTNSGTVPALTIVAKSDAGTLTHPHQTSNDPLDTNTDSPEHTYHRTVPNVNQGVWVMFEGGDPNFPVWMGVY